MIHNTTEIEAITEAFSMQPRTLSVWDEKFMHGKIKIDNIHHIDRVQVDQYEWVYIGYNMNGAPLFKYLEKSVNVHYKIPTK